MARIVRSPAARLDVTEIAAYIARDDPLAATQLLDTFDEKLHLLAETPELGRAREELAPGLRSFPVGRYVLFYRTRPDGIELVRVLHGARNLRRLFKRR